MNQSLVCRQIEAKWDKATWAVFDRFQTEALIEAKERADGVFFSPRYAGKVQVDGSYKTLREACDAVGRKLARTVVIEN